MFINFVILWLICLRHVLVHFKNRPDYLTRGTAQLLISLLRFLQQSFVSSFLIRLRYSVLFFLSSLFVWWSPLPIFPNICNLPFLQAFYSFCHLEFSISFNGGSFFDAKFVLISWVNIFIVCTNVYNFSFFANCLMTPMVNLFLRFR